MPLKNSFRRVNIPPVVLFFYFLAALFVSDDRLLVFNYGFIIRISMFLILPVMAFALFRFNLDAIMSSGVAYGIVWVGWNLAVSIYGDPNARNLAYAAWALLLLAWIICILLLPQGMPDALRLVKLYLWSIMCLSILGIFQAPSAYFVGHPILADQSWAGELVRSDGLCYEPSYYATYLIPAWYIFSWLLYKRDMLLGHRFVLGGWLLTSVALGFSTSRSGFIMIFLLGIFLFFHAVIQLFKGDSKSLFRVIGFGLFGFIGVFALLASIQFNYDILFGGTGLMDTASHSVDDRLNGTFYLWEIFKQNIFIGVGLGDLPIEVARLFGFDNISLEQAKDFDQGAVGVGILAGTGLIGGSIFGLWFFFVLKLGFRVAKATSAYGNLASAMIIAFIAQFVVLQFNQNILRPYVWFFWGVCISFWYSASLTRNVFMPRAEHTR